MRFVIDLQGAQFSGGEKCSQEYHIGLARAIAKYRGQHEILIALNGLLPDAIYRIRSAFIDLLPPDAIRVWTATSPVEWSDRANDQRRSDAELLREGFLASLKPDVVLISNLFGGLYDNGVTSIGKLTQLRTIVVHHRPQLASQASPNNVAQDWFQEKIEYLRGAYHIIATTDLAYKEAVDLCNISPEQITNVEAPKKREPPQSEATLVERYSALRILDVLLNVGQRSSSPIPSINRKPTLAFVSPLPPARSGIADYSSDLLPALAEHYEIEVVVAQSDVSDPWVVNNVAIRNPEWFLANSSRFDRVLYQFGNSAFHAYMVDLVERIPGVVVLHDFFLSGVHAFGQRQWMSCMLNSHGVQGVIASKQAGAKAIWDLPMNLRLLQHAAGTIVHSKFSTDLADYWYGSGSASSWANVPLVRRIPELDASVRAQLRRQLGLKDSDLIICSFGNIVETKRCVDIVEAFAAAAPNLEKSAKLIFVGEGHGDYGKRLRRLIDKLAMAGQIKITGWMDADGYQRYLRAADFAVQLRSNSRGETSASVLDCMAYGLPTVVNAHGSMAELEEEAVFKITDQFALEELVAALKRLAENPALRLSLGSAGREIVRERHSPSYCARLYEQAIEGFYDEAFASVDRLLRSLAGGRSDTERQLANAKALASNFPPRPRVPSLFVDVTIVADNDLRTGVQRVTRSILVALLTKRREALSVVPVRQTETGHFVVALRFVERLMGLSPTSLPEEPIDAFSGDVFLGLDLKPLHRQSARDEMRRLHLIGVKIFHVVYDLLPLQMPENFGGHVDWFTEWLSTITSFDGAVCISKAVAGELAAWIAREKLEVDERFRIGYFHLGADIDSSAPVLGMPASADELLKQASARPTFLMVSTVEPRKGHRQVLAAFELLWAQGVDVNLLLVGKAGWNKQLADFVRARADGRPHLFWPSDVSDELLERLYAASTCLIAASDGEGFGLPLIEAAQKGLPILARGLPVFREVGGEYATYFDGRDPEDLASAVKDWLDAWKRGGHAKSDGMPWLTWQASADQLLRAIGISSTASDRPTTRASHRVIANSGVC